MAYPLFRERKPAIKKLPAPSKRMAGIVTSIGGGSLRRVKPACPTSTEPAVQSELLRHSNIGTTLDLYTQAVSEQKRAAHGKVVGQLLAV